MKYSRQELRDKLKLRVAQGSHPQPFVVKEGEEHTCLNCGTTFRGKYCPGCGQRGDTGRLTLKSGVENVLGVLMSAESGLGHTLCDLVLRPGYMMRDYVMGHRKEYVRPIQLLFLLASVNVVLHLLFFQHFESDSSNLLTDKTGNPLHMEGILGVLVDWVNQLYHNDAAVSLAVIALLVIPMWLAFRPTEKVRKTSLVEFFYVMVYVSCLMMIFDILAVPLDFLRGETNSTGMGISLLIILWAVHQYFGLGWRKGLLRFFWGCIIAILMATPILVAVVLIFGNFKVQ